MLTFRIVSLNGSTDPIECDSVHLILCDNTMGKGGGSIGIRQGHIKSLLSVDQGKVIAYLDSKEVFSCHTDGGFATVEEDKITLVTKKAGTARSDNRDSSAILTVSPVPDSE